MAHFYVNTIAVNATMSWNVILFLCYIYATTCTGSLKGGRGGNAQGPCTLSPKCPQLPLKTNLSVLKVCTFDKVPAFCCSRISFYEFWLINYSWSLQLWYIGGWPSQHASLLPWLFQIWSTFVVWVVQSYNAHRIKKEDFAVCGATGARTGCHKWCKCGFQDFKTDFALIDIR